MEEQAVISGLWRQLQVKLQGKQFFDAQAEAIRREIGHVQTNMARREELREASRRSELEVEQYLRQHPDSHPAKSISSTPENRLYAEARELEERAAHLRDGAAKLSSEKFQRLANEEDQRRMQELSLLMEALHTRMLIAEMAGNDYEFAMDANLPDASRSQPVALELDRVNFSGKWCWQGQTSAKNTPDPLPSATLSLALIEMDGQITGHHCAVAQSGNRIDCVLDEEPPSVTGTVESGQARITYQSAYFDGSSSVKLIPKGPNLIWSPETPAAGYLPEGPIELVRCTL